MRRLSLFSLGLCGNIASRTEPEFGFVSQNPATSHHHAKASRTRRSLGSFRQTAHADLATPLGLFRRIAWEDLGPKLASIRKNSAKRIRPIHCAEGPSPTLRKGHPNSIIVTPHAGDPPSGYGSYQNPNRGKPPEEGIRSMEIHVNQRERKQSLAELGRAEELAPAASFHPD